MTDPNEFEWDSDFYKALVENTNEGVYVFSEDGQIEFVNQRVVDVSDISRTDWIGKHISDLSDLGVLTEEEVANVKQGIETTLESQESEIRIKLRPNVPHELRALELRLTSIQVDAGANRVIAFSRDVTEQQEYQRELERYQTLVQTVGDPMYVLDSQGTIQMVNEAMVDHLDVTEEVVIGTHISEFMEEGDFERGTALIRELLEDPTRKADTFEMTAVTPGGERIPTETHVGVLVNDHGEFRGSVGVVRDITERKQWERELQRKNDRLDDFANIVSHDLRNPLNVAEARLELAREECDSEHLDSISRAHDRMNLLIEDLLDLARAGELVSETEVVDLAESIEKSWKNVETADAMLRIKTTRSIKADRSRLKQFFENLFRNAVEHGGQDVTVTVGELDGGFYIEDDGPGIPENDRDEVLKAGYSTSDKGTGFGLSIVTQIVKAHDWEIRVTEGSESGARFEITGVEFIE